MKKSLLFVFVALLLWWASTAFYTVDFAEFGYVTRFGEPVATKDGATDAGLHLKAPWPIDTVLRIDRRLQSLELPATEALTQDKNGSVDKTLTVDAYVTFRIPDAQAADRFVRSLGTPEQAKKVLAPQVTGRLAAIIAAMSLDQLIKVVEPAEAEARSEQLSQKLLADGLPEKWRADYGLEIVSLRLRRLSYPEAVRASIYERIRSERSRKVADYENEGRREAAKTLSEADKKKREIDATARADKQVIEGKADAEADRLRNEAHAKDPEFYAFLQRLKSMQLALAESRDTLLLSLNHDFFKLMREPPKSAPAPMK